MPIPGATAASARKSVFSFLDLKPQFASMRTEIVEAVTRVLESQHFILGQEVEALEAEIARVTDSAFAVGCASGSDALLLALIALGIRAGDEVITSTFTFGATAGAIARLNARPVFVDIDPETYNLDVAHLEAAVTPQTKAIMPVHLFGLTADICAIIAIARAYHLPVIEDAAQAIGAKHYGKSAGNIGDVGCFSFFPSKNLGGAGDGGMLITRDSRLADQFKILRAHGSRRKYEYEVIGMNSRLDALQAAILRVKLRRLPDWTLARRHNAERYRCLFREYGLLDLVQLPTEPAGYTHVYNQFVVRVPERDRLRNSLAAMGIPTEVYYPTPLHLQRAFAYLGYKAGDFPQAESASRQVLALPIFPELAEEQQRLVVDGFAKFYAKQ